MIALLGALALVVDVGLLWTTQRELQKTVDAAAMAGVVLLPDITAARAPADCPVVSGGTPRCNTNWYIERNLEDNRWLAAPLCNALGDPVITAGELAVGNGTAYTLTVTMYCSARLTFGQLVADTVACPSPGDQVVSDLSCIRASATAVIGSTRNPPCPLPLAVSDRNDGLNATGGTVFADQPGVTYVDMARNGFGYQFGQLVELRVDTQPRSFQNFHALNFDGTNSASVYRQELAGDCPTVPDIQPGGVVNLFNSQNRPVTGPTRLGLQDRGLVTCSGSNQPVLCTNPNYPSPHEAFDLACPQNPLDLGPNDDSGVLRTDGSVKRSSPCLALTVVTMPLDSQQLPIEGFAEFFIIGWTRADNSILGMFVRGAPTLGELGAYDPLGTIFIRLIR
jgi:hypothetical protein